MAAAKATQMKAGAKRTAPPKKARFRVVERRAHGVVLEFEPRVDLEAVVSKVRIIDGVTGASCARDGSVTFGITSNSFVDPAKIIDSVITKLKAGYTLVEPEAQTKPVEATVAESSLLVENRGAGLDGLVRDVMDADPSMDAEGVAKIFAGPGFGHLKQMVMDSAMKQFTADPTEDLGKQIGEFVGVARIAGFTLGFTFR